MYVIVTTFPYPWDCRRIQHHQRYCGLGAETRYSWRKLRHVYWTSFGLLSPHPYTYHSAQKAGMWEGVCDKFAV